MNINLGELLNFTAQSNCLLFKPWVTAAVFQNMVKPISYFERKDMDVNEHEIILQCNILFIIKCNMFYFKGSCS